MRKSEGYTNHISVPSFFVMLTINSNALTLGNDILGREVLNVEL